MYPSYSMSIPLIDRLRQKGIRENVGCDDDATTVQFLEVVVKWKAAGGSFNMKLSNTELLYWSDQTPLEKRMAILSWESVYRCYG